MKNFLKEKKGVSLIIVIFAMMVLSVLGVVLANLQSTAFYTAVYQADSAKSFYVAEGGLLYVMERFNDCTDFSNFSSCGSNPPPTTDPPFGSSSISLYPGEFWVEYLNQTVNTVDIKITSRVRDSVRVIWQHLSVSIPEAFTKVQFSSGNINLSNSQGNVSGDIASAGNVNIGAAVIISGTVTEGSQLQIPEVDFNFYKNNANQVISGNLTFDSGTYGDPENGYIWYVEGNVKIKGNTTINGTIVTKGNLQLQSPKENIIFNTVPKNVDADPEVEQMPALVIAGNMVFSNIDNLTMNGLVYALGNIELNNSENVTLNGALIADGNININNADNINLVYDSSLVGDISGIEGGTGAMIVSHWKEM